MQPLAAPDRAEPKLAAAAAPLEDPRVAFAAERTLLAWVRTGIAMMGFGFVVARFALFARALFPGTDAEDGGWASAVGALLVVLGTVVNAGAAVRFWNLRRALAAGRSAMPGTLAPLLAAAVAALIGVALALAVARRLF